jgi:hypothetical protein
MAEPDPAYKRPTKVSQCREVLWCMAGTNAANVLTKADVMN